MNNFMIDQKNLRTKKQVQKIEENYGTSIKKFRGK